MIRLRVESQELAPVEECHCRVPENCLGERPNYKERFETMSVTPQIKNIRDLKATPRKPTLLHLTEDQWKAIIVDATQIDEIPNKHSFLEYTPTPDGGGILMADCGDPGPDEECVVRLVVSRDYSISYECICRKRRSGIPSGGGSGSTPTPISTLPSSLPHPINPFQCTLIIQQNPLRIVCRSATVGINLCKLKFVLSGGRYRLVCGI